MACNIVSARTLCLSFLLVSVASFPAVAAAPTIGGKVFDVRSYGARGDGTTDNTNAFLDAWTDACNWNGNSSVHVPVGMYKLRDVQFVGPCKGPITFVISGTLLAPENVDELKDQTWIAFRYVDFMTVTGGGTLDGKGPSAWLLNDCHKNTKCRPLTINMGFDFVKNSRIGPLRSLNSKAGHFNFFACSHINITDVTITAPGDSPNTDGIKIGFSDHFRITNTNIGTGDDCVALLSGNSEIDISNVNCGPGHGISVGSLGGNPKEKNFEGLTVKNCTFNGTSDGVRIKAWPSSLSQIVASKFLYEDIRMIDVGNPIVIDQQYCPHGLCKQESTSHVQIRDVKYNNIYGTTKSKVAVNLQCSKSFPCKNVELRDINLVGSSGSEGPAIASCANVEGSTYGIQVPQNCVG